MTNLASKIVFQHKVLGGEAFEKLIVCNTVRLTHTHTHTHTHRSRSVVSDSLRPHGL